MCVCVCVYIYIYTEYTKYSINFPGFIYHYSKMASLNSQYITAWIL